MNFNVNNTSASNVGSANQSGNALSTGEAFQLLKAGSAATRGSLVLPKGFQQSGSDSSLISQIQVHKDTGSAH